MGTQTYDETEPFDVLDRPTYVNDVKNIIDNKCAMCHSSTLGRIYKNIEYIDYKSTKPMSGELKGWFGIKLTGIEERTMPPGTKDRFSPKEIAILLKWEAQNFPEN